MKQRNPYQSLWEGTFPPPEKIRDPLDPCPARSPLDYGLRAHRLSWKSDHIALCKDCGGIYFQKEQHG